MGVTKRMSKSGPTYQVYYTFNGKQYFEPRLKDRQAAQRLDAQRKREIRLGTFRPSARAPRKRGFTAEDFFEEFIAARRLRQPPVRTVEDDHARLQHHVLPLWQGRSLVEITVEDLRALLSELRAKVSTETGRRLSANTVRNVFATLNVALSEVETRAATEGITWRNPCKLLSPTERPQKTRAPRDYYRRSEAEALISDPRVPFERRVFWALLFFTGMRHDETAGVRHEEIEWSHEPLPRLVLRRQADGGPLKEDKRAVGLVREIPIHPTLVRILRAWKEHGFEERFGRPPTPKDWLSPSTMDVTAYRPTRTSLKQIRADAELLGITPRTVHETRNTFLTLSAEDAPELESTLVRVTHQPQGHASETYRRTHWLAMCTAVERFQLCAKSPLHLPGPAEPARTPSLAPSPDPSPEPSHGPLALAQAAVEGSDALGAVRSARLGSGSASNLLAAVVGGGSHALDRASGAPIYDAPYDAAGRNAKTPAICEGFGGADGTRSLGPTYVLTSSRTLARSRARIGLLANYGRKHPRSARGDVRLA